KSKENNRLRWRLRHWNCLRQAWEIAFPDLGRCRTFGEDSPGAKRMIYKETFWMACDSTEQLRAEYGPFHTRAEAEREAIKLGFAYLLRDDHLLGEHGVNKTGRCIAIELPPD